MSRRLVLTVLLLGMAASSGQAQMSFRRGLLPSRPSLDQLGLTQNWWNVVPLGHPTERVLRISMADTMLFAQTNRAVLHAFDAESGRYLWTSNLGPVSAVAYPVAVNSDCVLVTSERTLHCLDRATGHPVWQIDLPAIAASPTAADEERAMVGLRDGKLVAYQIRDHSKDEVPGARAGTFLWAWKTAGEIQGRPIPANKVVAFGSGDGKVYVALLNREITEPAVLLFRYLTAGPIVASMGSLGTRTLLVPSTDNNLYSIDLFEAKTNWVYAMGSPLKQEPLVAGDSIYVVSEEGKLASINPETGDAIWEREIRGSELVSVSPSKLYLLSPAGDLIIGDRVRGTVLASPSATFERADLNLRDYSLRVTNRLNDRLYMATPSGLISCLRESGSLKPVPLRDPEALPFGYIPDPEVVTPPTNPSMNPLGSNQDYENLMRERR